MSNQLELRSTFRLSGEGLGAISVPNESVISSTFKTEQLPRPSDQENYKKNNFAVATTISQAIINGLGTDLRDATESYSSKKLASKINKLFSANANHLSLNSLSDELCGYDFNNDHSFDSGVSTKFFVKKGAHCGHVIFHIPAFVPQVDLKVPKGATNFKIDARLIAISDFEKIGGEFHTTNIRQHGQTANYQSPMLPLLRITTQPITAQLNIVNRSFSAAGLSSVLVLGIEYFEYDKKKFNRLDDCTRMKILEVF